MWQNTKICHILCGAFVYEVAGLLALSQWARTYFEQGAFLCRDLENLRRNILALKRKMKLSEQREFFIFRFAFSQNIPP